MATSDKRKVLVTGGAGKRLQFPDLIGKNPTR